MFLSARWNKLNKFRILKRFIISFGVRKYSRTMSDANSPIFPTKPTEDHFVNLGKMRKPYETDILFNLQVKEPFALFKQWFELACRTPTIQEANAMVITTCTKSCLPSSRYVLLKMFDNEGFAFFTNYNSRKGREIEENPNVALLFYWDILHRQVRIEGKAHKVSREMSEEYFHSRPYDSQVSAVVSPQSQVIESRESIEKIQSDMAASLNGEEVPTPNHWGGFKVIPESFEFWQGQSNRLHHRVVFLRDSKIEPDDKLTHKGENGWVYQLIAP